MKVYYNGGLPLSSDNDMPLIIRILGRPHIFGEPGSYLELNPTQASYLINRYPVDDAGFRPFSLTPMKMPNPSEVQQVIQNRDQFLDSVTEEELVQLIQSRGINAEMMNTDDQRPELVLAEEKEKPKRGRPKKEESK